MAPGLFAAARPGRRLVAGSLAIATLAAIAAGAGTTVAHATSHVTQLAHNSCKRNQIDVPRCGVLWGIYLPAQPAPGGWIAPYAQVEGPTGRKFDIVRNYVDWKRGVTFPTKAEASFAKAHGVVLSLSWSAVDYTTRARVSYASIASGQWDSSVILPEARALKRFRHPVFVDFDAEFDNVAKSGSGTPAQYVAAYRHIHRVMRLAGVTNVIWTWISTGYVGHTQQIAASYPGAAFVNWIGYDPYNFAQCQSTAWRSPYQTFQPFYRWLTTQPAMRKKPIMLGEYASAPGPAVGSWYANVAGALRRLPRIKAAMQWSSATSPTCDFRLTDSTAALAGFAKSSHAPYITGVAR
jgi:hypothetical protein